MTELAALRVARDQGRLAHALVFVSADFARAESAALEVAGYILCETGSACGVCPSCQRLARLAHESLHEITPLNGVIKIEQIRPLRQSLGLENWQGARVVLIRGAEHLNPQAANALLKVLEEPPAATYFLLSSANLTAVMPTVRSRSQVVRLPAQDRVVGEWRDRFRDETQLVEWSDRVWRALAEGRLPDEDWREIWRDRETALRAIAIWAEILRAARRLSLGLGGESADPTVLQLAGWGTGLDHSWRGLLNLKTEIEAQVDRSLAVESYWRQQLEALS